MQLRWQHSVKISGRRAFRTFQLNIVLLKCFYSDLVKSMFNWIVLVGVKAYYYIYLTISNKSITNVFTETKAATRIVGDHLNNINLQLNQNKTTFMKCCCKNSHSLTIYLKEIIKYHVISLKVQPF